MSDRPNAFKLSLVVVLLISLILVGVLWPSQRLLPGRLRLPAAVFLRSAVTEPPVQLSDVNDTYDFLPDRDLLVFLQIQKTSGSEFGRLLVRNLMEPACSCPSDQLKSSRCDCLTPNGNLWLFSRRSVGWPCGVHPDWTELMTTGCLRRYVAKFSLDSVRAQKYSKTANILLFTILREPVQRYISEWLHVRRGATWKTAGLFCGGRQASISEVPFCYDGDDWFGVQLDQFLACDSNLAHNRQARMLADLRLVGCYSNETLARREKDEIVLRSAMEHLNQMAFFALAEHQVESARLFEATFNLKLAQLPEQRLETRASFTNITDDQLRAIRQRNRIDLILYRFAEQLFFSRYRRLTSDNVTHFGHHMTQS